jgi:hypothetical protein
MDCASRGPVNILETKFNWLYKNGKLKNSKWLEDNGFVKNGDIEFSDAFVAINSGTTREGNSLKAPLEAIRKQGMIPKLMLPKEDFMTFDEYHSPKRITEKMKNLGQEFVSRFTIRYEKVYEEYYGDLLKQDLLNVAGFAWSSPINGEYPRTDEQPNHCFVIYKTPKYYAFDNYIDFDNDFIKKLAPDYNFVDYGYRLYISENEISKLSLFEKILNILKQILLLDKQIIEMKKTKLEIFALAIRSHEGWSKVSRSFRNNNPGNLRISEYTKSLGAISRDDKNFCIFPDYQTGFNALKQFLKDASNRLLKPYHIFNSSIPYHKKLLPNGKDGQELPDLMLIDFFSIYAPAEDNNNCIAYANDVAKKCGVSSTSLLKDVIL